MCGHKIEVKLFSFFFFNFFFLKLELHITTTMIYDFGTQTFLRCSSVAGSANCWSIGLLSDSSLYEVKKLKKKPKKRSNFRKSTYRIIVSSNFPNPSLKSSAEKQSNSFVDIANTFCSSSSEPSSAKAIIKYLISKQIDTFLYVSTDLGSLIGNTQCGKFGSCVISVLVHLKPQKLPF